MRIIFVILLAMYLWIAIVQIVSADEENLCDLFPNCSCYEDPDGKLTVDCHVSEVKKENESKEYSERIENRLNFITPQINRRHELYMEILKHRNTSVLRNARINTRSNLHSRSILNPIFSEGHITSQLLPHNFGGESCANG